MAKRHISPLTLRDVWDKLEEIEIENKKTKGITMVALGFAFFAVTIPLLYEIIPPSIEAKLAVVIVYSIVGGYIFYIASQIKVKKL